MHAMTAPRALTLSVDFRRVFGGGFVASLAMTAVVYLGPLVGIPNVDFAAMLGSILSAEPPMMFTAAWWAGLAWHVVNGTVIFSLIYTTAVRGLVPLHPILRGIVWATALWLLCQAMAMPIVGGGFFSKLTSDPTQVVLGSLAAHWVYGVVLGAMVKQESVAESVVTPFMDEERRTHQAA